MGYYTHGWREQPDNSTTAKSAREIAEAGGPGCGEVVAEVAVRTVGPVVAGGFIEMIKGFFHGVGNIS